MAYLSVKTPLMEKIPVYFMPGLAASSKIFENIALDAEKYEVVFMEWLLPEGKESLVSYVKRLADTIIHKNPVLIGVSFGGVIVQEMAKIIEARKVIIISSIKCNTEFPRRMRFARKTHAYRLFPTGLMQNVDRIAKYAFGNNLIAKRLKMYEKYLSVRDKKYLDWAFKSILLWDRCEPDANVVHIHGTSDEVFPSKYVKGFIPVEGGTHIMIINKFRWMNENLPLIIEGDMKTGDNRF